MKKGERQLQTALCVTMVPCIILNIVRANIFGLTFSSAALLLGIFNLVRDGQR